jgi:hypothetical protein
MGKRCRRDGARAARGMLCGTMRDMLRGTMRGTCAGRRDTCEVRLLSAAGRRYVYGALPRVGPAMLARRLAHSVAGPRPRPPRVRRAADVVHQEQG